MGSAVREIAIHIHQILMLLNALKENALEINTNIQCYLTGEIAEEQLLQNAVKDYAIMTAMEAEINMMRNAGLKNATMSCKDGYICPDQTEILALETLENAAADIVMIMESSQPDFMNLVRIKIFGNVLVKEIGIMVKKAQIQNVTFVHNVVIMHYVIYSMMMTMIAAVTNSSAVVNLKQDPDRVRTAIQINVQIINVRQANAQVLKQMDIVVQTIQVFAAEPIAF